VGVEQFAAMQAALAAPPLQTCVRVNTLRTTPQVSAAAAHDGPKIMQRFMAETY